MKTIDAKATILALILALALLTLAACSGSPAISGSAAPSPPASEETGPATPEPSAAAEAPQPSSEAPSGISPSAAGEEDIAESVPEYYQLLVDEKASFVAVVRERVAAYRNGTPPDNPNHHPPYPSDFPPVSMLPDIQTEHDFAIRFTGNADALGGIYAAVPVDGTHEMHLTISQIAEEGNALSWGSGDTWFERVSDAAWELQDIDLYDGSLIESSPAAPVPEGTFESVLAEYGEEEYVIDNTGADPLLHAALLEEWVANYRQGIPGKVAVLLDGGPFPSSLFVLESDGDASYIITEYPQYVEGLYLPPRAPVAYESSMIVRRAYDYVFGADLPADTPRASFVVHHTAQSRFTEREDMAWDPDRDAPLGSITPEEAEDRAAAVNSRLSAYSYFLDNIYGGGVYVRDSMAEAAPPPDYAGHTFYHKTVRAVRFGGDPYYMVYGHIDREALERGEHGGNVTAVSADGRLVFIVSMVDGGWIFMEDAEQEVIVYK